MPSIKPITPVNPAPNPQVIKPRINVITNKIIPSLLYPKINLCTPKGPNIIAKTPAKIFLFSPVACSNVSFALSANSEAVSLASLANSFAFSLASPASSFASSANSLALPASYQRLF